MIVEDKIETDAGESMKDTEFRAELLNLVNELGTVDERQSKTARMVLFSLGFVFTHIRIYLMHLFSL
jgi:hypothetical protein